MKRLIITIIVLLILLNLKYFAYLSFFQIPSSFKVTYFDVGQADSAFINVPNSTIQILIDAGDAGTIPLLNKINEQMPIGDDCLDIVVLSHYHQDHFSGLQSIIENYDIGFILETGSATNDEQFLMIDELINTLQIPRLKASRGLKLEIENLYLEVLHPYYSNDLEYKNENNASIVLLMTYKSQFTEKKLLFLGDLEAEGERELLSYLTIDRHIDRLSVDFIKIAHHGSSNATGQEMINIFKPTKAIISVGKNNSFGHPDKNVIERIKTNNIELLRTDLNGDIEFRIY